MTSIMQQVAKASADLEKNRKANDFVRFALIAAESRGDFGLAIKLAEARKSSPAIVQMVKSTISPAAAADHLTDLAQYSVFASSFVSSLAPFGAFDFIAGAGGFLRIPMHSKIGLTSVGINGDTVGEGKPMPFTRISFDGSQLQEQKSSAIVAASDELVKIANQTPAAFNLFAVELKRAIARATDVAFLDSLVNFTGVPTISSGGLSGQEFGADLAQAARLVQTGADSQLFCICPPSALKQLALARVAGVAAFEDLDVTGGDIAGITFTLSDALSDEIILLDAAQCAADVGTVQIDASRHGGLQIDSAPGEGSQQLLSFWQNNLQALRAQRWWAAESLRDTAVCVITGVATTA